MTLKLVFMPLLKPLNKHTKFVLFLPDICRIRPTLTWTSNRCPQQLLKGEIKGSILIFTAIFGLFESEKKTVEFIQVLLCV